MDGAITKAGGLNLYSDRLALAASPDGARCKTGGAVTTGPITYGELRTPIIIHSVGLNHKKYIGNGINGNVKLLTAYSASMRRAEEQERKYVAFSLLSAGAFCGSNRTIHQVLKLSVQAGRDCRYKGLREVHLYGYTAKTFLALVEVAYTLGLVRCG